MRINAKFTSGTVPSCKRKLFISRSYQILVLTIVLGRLRHTYAKNIVKNYQGRRHHLRQEAHVLAPRAPAYARIMFLKYITF